MQRRDAITFGLTALPAQALAPLRAFAPSRYPERPIRLVIPFTPGASYVDSNPAKARRFVEDEIARWTPIIKAIGLKLE